MHLHSSRSSELPSKMATVLYVAFGTLGYMGVFILFAYFFSLTL